MSAAQGILVLGEVLPANGTTSRSVGGMGGLFLYVRAATTVNARGKIVGLTCLPWLSLLSLAP